MRLHKTLGHPKHWTRLFIAFLFSAAIVSAAPTLASATVVGDLQTGSAGTFTFSLSSLTWNTDPSSTPPGPPWNSEVVTGTHLTFAGCPSGTLGTPGCLIATEGIEVAQNMPIIAGAGFGPNNPFFQFAGNGTTHATILYTIATLGPGSSNTSCAGLSIGQSCSIFVGSPLILTDTAAGTTVSLAGGGTATDGSGSSRWLGEFSVPIAGMTPQQIQTFFCPSGTCMAADFSSGRSLSSSNSGDFLARADVPEPGTLALMGSALIGLLSLRRRKLH